MLIIRISQVIYFFLKTDYTFSNRSEKYWQIATDEANGEDSLGKFSFSTQHFFKQNTCLDACIFTNALLL